MPVTVRHAQSATKSPRATAPTSEKKSRVCNTKLTFTKLTQYYGCGARQTADLFNREHEWATLSEFVSDPTPGLRIGIVYGRRRQGKSFPLRRLASATGGFYYQALEHEASQALAELGESIGTHLGFCRLALASWEEAISSLGRLAPAKADWPLLAGLPQSGVASSSVMKPSVAILDEFPYLLERSPELPSLLQRSVDRSREENGPAIRLILCGSAISVMANLLEAKAHFEGECVLTYSFGRSATSSKCGSGV